MHEFPRHVLVRLPPVLGLDLSITNAVVLLWVSAAVTFLLVFPACRRRSPVPRGFLQNAFEGMVAFVEREVVGGSIGTAGPLWAPLLLALFFFILFCNLLGMLPLPTLVQAPTASLSVTAGLASIVFATVLAVNLRRHGPVGFARKFVPPGVHWALLPLLVPIEVISWLAKPVSLAIRLFANMLAGHALIMIFVGLEMTAAWLLKPLPLAGAVVMSGFELFVCFIQAFIFTMLTGIYIREAIEAH